MSEKVCSSVNFISLDLRPKSCSNITDSSSELFITTPWCIRLLGCERARSGTGCHTEEITHDLGPLGHKTGGWLAGCAEDILYHLPYLKRHRRIGIMFNILWLMNTIKVKSVLMSRPHFSMGWLVYSPFTRRARNLIREFNGTYRDHVDIV